MALLCLVVCLMLGWSSAARAEWTYFTKGLNEFDIRALAVDPRDPQVIFVGTPKRVYKTADGGRSWKSLLSLRGSDVRIRAIYFDPFDSQEIYVCSDRGVHRSLDGGKRWELFYQAAVGSKTAYCILRETRDTRNILIGTAQGLFEVSLEARQARKVGALDSTAVYSILEDTSVRTLFISSAKGILKSTEDRERWEPVWVRVEAPSAAEKEPGQSLEQFGIEEMRPQPPLSNLVFLGHTGKFYAGGARGVLEGSQNGNSWNFVGGQNLGIGEIRALARSSQTFYAGTEQGVFQWDPKTQSFQSFHEGLESKDVQTLVYSPGGDYLLAGTRAGVLKWSYPELKWGLPVEETPMTTADILLRFENEPSIAEVQSIAIRYAEVHPEKIETWRRAASRKAFLPTLSVGTDWNRDENVDIDRGGTGDPDKFIHGPYEKSFDWSVGVSWDLADLIWNSDQTSIDTRSRLMVELRDDILNEVTNLYYARRRLEAEMAMSPSRDLPIQVEKEIRLEELTARLDALTGGYFSKRLARTR